MLVRVRCMSTTPSVLLIIGQFIPDPNLKPSNCHSTRKADIDPTWTPLWIDRLGELECNFSMNPEPAYSEPEVLVVDVDSLTPPPTAITESCGKREFKLDDSKQKRGLDDSRMRAERSLVKRARAGRLVGIDHGFHYGVALPSCTHAGSPSIRQADCRFRVWDSIVPPMSRIGSNRSGVGRVCFGSDGGSSRVCPSSGAVVWPFEVSNPACPFIIAVTTDQARGVFVKSFELWSIRPTLPLRRPLRFGFEVAPSFLQAWPCRVLMLRLHLHTGSH